MNIHLSEHFTYTKLLRFALPTIIMMICTSIYNVVDGIFVAKYVGPTAFAATHVMIPIIMLLGCIGFMFGTGGNALVAKLLGEKKKVKANQVFSLLIYTTFILGGFFTILGLIIIGPVADYLGLQGILRFNSIEYSNIVLLATIPLIFQFFFHPFMITAERPQLGLLITATAGLSNVLLDALFIIKFNWGVPGAAWATVISEIIGGFVPLLFFMCPNKTPLHLGKAVLDFFSLFKSIGNGMSEFVSHISMSFVGMLYNYQLLKYAGENGVVAFGVIASTNFLFISLFVGYSLGTSSIISYHFGAKNTDELKSLLHKNIRILLCLTIGLTILAELLAGPVTRLFIENRPDLASMAKNGFMIYVLSYLVAGYNIYASAFFTALNNGVISAIISLARTFVFQSACILILPIILGINGIWGSIIVAEISAFLVSAYFIYTKRHKYHYL